MEINNEEKPNYYAIIPANIRYDDRICANAKLLYGEITALCNDKGFCWAGNEYFASLYKTTKETISRWIRQLKEREYIKVQIFYKKDSKEIDKRIIAISNQYPIDENVNTPCQKNQCIPIDKKIKTSYQKSQDPIDKNVKENTTSINNTINNNIYSQVVEFLNQKASKSFKSTSQKTRKLIQARLNDGYSLEDFKKVINIKTREWINDKTMSKSLRPETLFGTKFESYLNEETIIKINNDENSCIDEYKEMERRFRGG